MKDYKALIARAKNAHTSLGHSLCFGLVGELKDALEELTAPVKSEPVGHFYKDERGFWRQAGDPIGFPAMEKLYPESRVRELEQQVEMLRDACRKVSQSKASAEVQCLALDALAATEGEK